MKLSEKVNFTIALTAVPPATAGFSVPGLIVDAVEVPVYQRYIIVTRSDYATTLTTTTTAADWCGKLWYTGNVAQAYIIRWASTAQAPAFVMQDYNTTVADWTAITLGDFAITDGTSTEEFATGTMAAVTSMADVAAIIETEVQTSTTFAADLSAATVEIDALGNMVLTSATTGAAADTYSIIAPTAGGGTDITTSGFLNLASKSFEVAGIDAEDPDDALAAVLELEDEIRIIHEIGSSISQQNSLATACASYGKILELNVRDANAKDANDTTSIAYLLSNASNSYARGVYTEHASDYPGATENGQILTRPEGSASFANNPLSGVYKSGLGGDGSIIDLTPTERLALDAVNCDYLVTPRTNVMCNHGLTFAGIEMKHRVGYSWAELRAAEEIEAYLELNEVVFSDTDIQTICGIIFKYLDILIDRGCSSSYTINIPSAADIALVEQATHTLTLSEVAAIISAYAINDVVATATATA